MWKEYYCDHTVCRRWTVAVQRTAVHLSFSYDHDAGSSYLGNVSLPSDSPSATSQQFQSTSFHDVRCVTGSGPHSRIGCRLYVEHADRQERQQSGERTERRRRGQEATACCAGQCRCVTSGLSRHQLTRSSVRTSRSCQQGPGPIQTPGTQQLYTGNRRSRGHQECMGAKHVQEEHKWGQ